MEILVKVVQFFICFTLLVGIHEFGHFISARIFKMRVDKFYIFFDPWFSIFKRKIGDTEYGIGWLPLGGYCKIAGMVDESMDKEQLAQPAQPDEFRAKPAWQRLIVMVAGVVMNLLLAIAIYIGVCYAWGESYLPASSAKWGYSFNEAAEGMGFESGDKILKIDDVEITSVDEITTMLLLSDADRNVVVKRSGVVMDINIPLEDLIETRKAKKYRDLVTPYIPFIVDSVSSDGARALQRGDEIIALNDEKLDGYYAYREAFGELKGEDVALTALRGADTIIMRIPVSSEGLIGVYTSNPYRLVTRNYTFLEAIPAGISRTGASISSYWQQLSLIFQPKTEMYRELGGFVAIGSMFSSVWNWEDFWLKTAFLSIMLAIMNILPIPGLDGGHSLITIFEIVTGRKPSDKFLEVTQYIGLILILALMLYANGNDFHRLIFG